MTISIVSYVKQRTCFDLGHEVSALIQSFLVLITWKVVMMRMPTNDRFVPDFMSYVISLGTAPKDCEVSKGCR